MRRYRSALILLVILALMAGGYYFYTSIWPDLNPDSGGGDGDAAETPTTSVNRLIDRSTQDIRELTINYLNEEYVAIKEIVMEVPEGGTAEREVTRWRLTNRSDFPVNGSRLSTAASNFCVITSSKVVEENVYDFSQYGFGGPNSARASAVFDDGSVRTLEIGDKNPTNDGYYLRVDGGDTVFLGSTYASERIMITKQEIADLKLFAIEAPEIERMEMKRGGELLFTFASEGEFSWELEYPVIAPFNMTAQGMILQSLSEVSAIEYTDIGASDLEQYGLDKPRYSLLFELGGGRPPVELLFGYEVSVRSTVYAMLGGTSDVFVLSLENFGYLDKPIKDFVEAFAYIISISEVNHIEAIFDGRSVNIELFVDYDSDEDDVFIMDGTDVSDLNNDSNRSLFRLFYQSMIGVTIYDIEPGAKPDTSGGPEITFTYDLKSEPFRMVVEFYPKDERMYYVYRNGAYAGIVVEKRFFDRPDEGLRPTYADLVNAINATG